LCNELHDVSRLSRLIKISAPSYTGAMENAQDRLSRALDEALEMTFPASDPISITPPHAMLMTGEGLVFDLPEK
jgi:hypothetical protein